MAINKEARRRIDLQTVSLRTGIRESCAVSLRAFELRWSPLALLDFSLSKSVFFHMDAERVAVSEIFTVLSSKLLVKVFLFSEGEV